MHGAVRRHRSIFVIVSSVFALVISAAATRAAASAVNMTAPANGSSVSGTVMIVSAVSDGVVWVNFYIDGSYLVSSPPYIINWDSNTVANGRHTISVIAFGANNTPLGSSSVTVRVYNAPEIVLSTPLRGATVSGIAKVTISTQSNVLWSNFYVDGVYEASTPPSTWSWDTTSYPNGSHVVSANAYSPAGTLLGSASATVTVANNSVTPGAIISGLTGSAGAIWWADTNPAHYGQYNAPGGNRDGMGLIGGPLLNDLQAASFVVPTQSSSIETGVNGPANQAANNYFNNIAATNPSSYLDQLNANNGLYAAYVGSSFQAEIDRIDGACPLANPTTAEVLQWAANKWGINPLLLYADAANESGWDQTAIGDSGLSAGVFQVADRNSNARPYHAFPGFDGAGSMLARENTCFNADFFGAWVFASFHGIVGSPGGDIGVAIQSWYSGSATSAGSYTFSFDSILNNNSWIPWYFNGTPVAY
jgi:hypothetical protein